jgi:hypothetical protein
MELEIGADNPAKKSTPGFAPRILARAAHWLGWMKEVRARSTSPIASLFVFTTIAYLFIGHADARLGPQGGIRPALPRAVSGDEPHYLVIINSLLFDHDLRLDPDFKRIAAGGYEAGLGYRGHPSFGGHSFLVDQRTGRSAKCPEGCDAAIVETVGGNPEDHALYPAHPIGFPLLVALLAWPLQPEPAEVEPLVGRLTLLIAIAGVLLAYAAARKGGLAPTAAAATALLLGFASSWLPYARSYFSESAIGVFVLLGFLALQYRRPALAGLAVGVAITMKSVFALCGIAWVVERIWSKRYKEALWLTVAMGLCGAVQMVFNLAMLRSPVTVGAANWTSAHGLQSFVATLFEPAHGLLMFMPWACIPFIWGPVAARANPEVTVGLLTVTARRQLVLPLLMFLAVYSIIGWGPGYCYGARYWIALLPFLAMLTIDFAVAGAAWRRQLVSVLAAMAMLIAVPGAIKYTKLFSRPAASAIFLDPPR